MLFALYFNTIYFFTILDIQKQYLNVDKTNPILMEVLIAVYQDVYNFPTPLLIIRKTLLFYCLLVETNISTLLLIKLVIYVEIQI